MRSIAPARLTMAPLKRQSVFSREKRPVRATYGNALMQQVVGGADSRADGRFGIVVVVVVSFGGTAEGLPSPPPFGSVLFHRTYIYICISRQMAPWLAPWSGAPPPIDLLLPL